MGVAFNLVEEDQVMRR